MLDAQVWSLCDAQASMKSELVLKHAAAACVLTLGQQMTQCWSRGWWVWNHDRRRVCWCVAFAAAASVLPRYLQTKDWCCSICTKDIVQYIQSI